MLCSSEVGLLQHFLQLIKLSQALFCRPGLKIYLYYELCLKSCIRNCKGKIYYLRM